MDEIKSNLSFATRVVHEKVRIEGLTKLNDHVEKLKIIVQEILDLKLSKDYFINKEIDNVNYFLEEDLIFFYETGYNDSAFDTLVETINFVERISNVMIFKAKYDYLNAYNSLLIETKKELV